jgi:hypothetical protein
MKETSFKAPWGAPLAVMTALCGIVCLFLAMLGAMICLGNAATTRALGISMIPPYAGQLLIGASLLAFAAGAALMVRGYILTENSLRIKRLGWETRLDLARLQSATADADAFRGSLRLFGNGGFFSFTGWYRNRKLGVFRAYATHAAKAVVLRLADKTVVVTPDDPQKFVAEINSNRTLPVAGT